MLRQGTIEQGEVDKIVRRKNVLFVCTGNSARSILAEALLNRLGAGRFRAFSAGSRPAGQVSSTALELLEEKDLATAGLSSKSWEAFEGPEAPPLDMVITVCDNAASEPCPVWPRGPTRAHWGLPDPAAVEEPQARRQAFRETYAELERRIGKLLALPVESMGKSNLEAALNEIGGHGK